MALSDKLNLIVKRYVGRQLPLLIQAEFFGWVQRSRLFWATIDGLPLRIKDVTPPESVEISRASRRGQEFDTLQWKGKPVPPSCTFKSGYLWPGKPKDVAGNGEGAMSTFSRQFK